MLTPTFNALYSQDESSEMFIGEWAEARGIRDQLFIATKVRIIFPPFNAVGHPQTLTCFFSVHLQLQGS
jgi:aryl-alcohol dehydrogenase-like predicted oxidoreductase